MTTEQQLLNWKQQAEQYIQDLQNYLIYLNKWEDFCKLSTCKKCDAIIIPNKICRCKDK